MRKFIQLTYGLKYFRSDKQNKFGIYFVYPSLIRIFADVMEENGLKLSDFPERKTEEGVKIYGTTSYETVQGHSSRISHNSHSSRLSHSSRYARVHW